MPDTRAHEDRAAILHDLETAFSDLFARTRALFRDTAERVHPGMLPGTYRVFSVIVRHGPVTASAITEALVLDKAQVSRTVRELVDLGLIHRAPDPADGRSSLLSATDAGRRRLDEAVLPMKSDLEGGLSRWPDEQIREFTEMLIAFTERRSPEPRD
ncbi:MarR family winged helix-turn-helix transcriptional regulator [Microbacterium gorillae]|uniref:MarR family winged helix-turn-helix transcriptional regulator n=1 Tax=Microbacterium gorillae TaxID=1231063 RepID=UPI00058E727F|nr:MarR family winged helix-turn-helix transcriptional regulator [Microbacterium gorillae]